MEYFDEEYDDAKTLESTDEKLGEILYLANHGDFDRKNTHSPQAKTHVNKHIPLFPENDVPLNPDPTPECKNGDSHPKSLVNGRFPDAIAVDTIQSPHPEFPDLVDADCVDSLEATLAMDIELNLDALMPREILHVARARMSSARFYQ
ncbi:hypothetical protein C8R43DRAFT_1118584 [Mycena crocata]|nr:hypothetical protein C8R43DRAFT_1118584 [Mycena crocata]